MSIKTLEERAGEMAGDFMRRLEAVMEALTNTSRPPAELSLRVRHLPDARLRRDIARLRSGVLQPSDPSVKAGTLADDLDKELACRLLSRQILAQVAYMHDLLSSEMEIGIRRHEGECPGRVPGVERPARSPGHHDRTVGICPPAAPAPP